MRNPFRKLMKPKEKPDNPIDRIPEEWRRRNNTQPETMEAPAKRGRGRPPKQKPAVPAPKAVQEAVPPAPQIRKKPLFMKRRYMTKNDIRLPNMPSVRGLMRMLAGALLVAMLILVAVALWQFVTVPNAPTYLAIFPLLIALVLADYIRVTGGPE
jgi:hypothetical protein